MKPCIFYKFVNLREICYNDIFYKQRGYNLVKFLFTTHTSHSDLNLNYRTPTLLVKITKLHFHHII